jgi:oligopeptide/dipeptide ABC transporter ATP-binding protein
VDDAVGVIAPAAPLLEVDDLVVTYRARRRAAREGQSHVVALDGVSLQVWPGESVGVVGESGSGKSTLARAVVGLVRPASGEVRFHGESLTHANPRQLRELRREMQMVFQDPYGSVNPKFSVRNVVAEPLENYHRDWSAAQREARVADLLARVRLAPELAERSVGGLSGGQLQRVGIARALALDPRLVVADEPVSALDVSIQASILNLLADLKRTDNISYLFITHNLAVAQYIADRIVVVYGGRVMEVGASDDVIGAPLHPYTKELLAAVPGVRLVQEVDASRPRPTAAPTAGEVGCPYRTRCPLATEVCGTTTPPLELKRPGRLVACHHVAVQASAIDNGQRAAQ